MAATSAPGDRALIARIAAHSKWAQEPDRAAATAAARKAALDRFEKEADPDSTLPPGERAIRAEHLRKAHFARMALRSVQARRLKAKAAAMEAETVAELAEMDQEVADQ